jgi:hypothetical protein
MTEASRPITPDFLPREGETAKGSLCFGYWKLVIGAYLGLGTWNLGFLHLPDQFPDPPHGSMGIRGVPIGSDLSGKLLRDGRPSYENLHRVTESRLL